MMYSLVRDLAVMGTPLRVPITVACRVLGFSPQAFHRWVKNPVSDRDWDEAHLINAAFDAHADDPRFGYRLISDELTGQGFTASERRVWRLCSQQRLWSVFSKKRGKASRPGPPVHDDLVKRQCTADAPNKLWLTDITEHRTGEGKLNLCAIKDVFANKIVGYSIDSRMKARLAVDALEMAAAHRGRPTGVVVHSDRLNSPNSGHGSSCGRWPVTSCSVRWDVWPWPATTRPWNRSSRYCRRTYSISDPGSPGPSYAARSFTGSRRRITVAADNADSANSHQSSSRP